MLQMDTTATSNGDLCLKTSKDVSKLSRLKLTIKTTVNSHSVAVFKSICSENIPQIIIKASLVDFLVQFHAFSKFL